MNLAKGDSKGRGKTLTAKMPLRVTKTICRQSLTSSASGPNQLLITDLFLWTNLSNSPESKLLYLSIHRLFHCLTMSNLRIFWVIILPFFRVAEMLNFDFSQVVSSSWILQFLIFKICSATNSLAFEFWYWIL